MDAVKRRPAAQIVLHGQILIQHRVLEHHAQVLLDAAGIGVQIGTADGDDAAVLGKLAA